MPERIRRQRTKGWRLPEGAVVVSRPSRWGNPFKVGERAPAEYGAWMVGDAFTAVALFKTALAHVLEGFKDTGEYNPLWDRFNTPDDARWALEELRDRDLCCWCRLGDPCHADVLLEVVAGLPKPVKVNPAELYGALVDDWCPDCFRHACVCVAVYGPAIVDVPTGGLL